MERALGCLQEVVLRRQRQHCQALLVLLSNQAEGEFLKVEGAWIDGGLFSLALVQSASVCRIRQENGEWEKGCKGQMITSRTLRLSACSSEGREDETVCSYSAEI